MTRSTERLASLVYWMLIVWSIMYFGAWMLGYPNRDDTDPPNGRSGMRLYTDAATGCQYLGTMFGGVTPRHGAGGSHIGCKP